MQENWFVLDKTDDRIYFLVMFGDLNQPSHQHQSSSNQIYIQKDSYFRWIHVVIIGFKHFPDVCHVMKAYHLHKVCSAHTIFVSVYIFFSFTVFSRQKLTFEKDLIPVILFTVTTKKIHWKVRIDSWSNFTQNCSKYIKNDILSEANCLAVLSMIPKEALKLQIDKLYAAHPWFAVKLASVLHIAIQRSTVHFTEQGVEQLMYQDKKVYLTLYP